MWDNYDPTYRANHAIGNDMSLPKSPHTTRVHFQNLNGVSLHKGGTWEQCCEQWREMEVDIALACEHKVDTNHSSNMSAFYQQATTTLGQSTFALVAASTPTTGRRFDSKSSGTMAMVIGPSKGRIRSMHKDPAGRWVSVTFNRTRSAPITVISTYQVVDVDPTAVGDSKYANQLAGFYTADKRHQPHRLRKHHSDDLTTFVKDLQRDGHSVLLAGDFNESLGEELTGMSSLASECQLIDAVVDWHGPMQFTTYQRGQKVLDYILVSQDLLGSIRSCGYEPFQANIFSDHRGTFIDFSTGHLFGKKLQPLAPPSLRDISSNKPHQMAPYWQEKHNFLKDKNWYEGDKASHCNKSTVR